MLPSPVGALALLCMASTLGQAPRHHRVKEEARWVRASPPVGFAKCSVDFDAGKGPEAGAPAWATMNNWFFERKGFCTNGTFARWHAELTSDGGDSIDSRVYLSAPHFDGVTLFLVGDSLCRDQFVDLVCTLSKQEGTHVTIPYNNLGSTRYGPHYEQFLAEIRVRSTVFWIAFTYFASLKRDNGYLDHNAKALLSQIALRKKKWHREALYFAHPLVFHVCSVKAHSLGTRGYSGNYLAYFDELSGLASRLKNQYGWSAFYYRPGPATHFATAEAGYIPTSSQFKRESPQQCSPLKKGANAQKQLFQHEENSFVGRLNVTGRVAVVPHVWDLSAGAWNMHPGLAPLRKNHSQLATDCLHFCVAGDGQVGVYEAFNRLWWWDMLNHVLPADRATDSATTGRLMSKHKLHST